MLEGVPAEWALALQFLRSCSGTINPFSGTSGLLLELPVLSGSFWGSLGPESCHKGFFPSAWGWGENGAFSWGYLGLLCVLSSFLSIQPSLPPRPRMGPNLVRKVFLWLGGDPQPHDQQGLGGASRARSGLWGRGAGHCGLVQSVAWPRNIFKPPTLYFWGLPAKPRGCVLGLKGRCLVALLGTPLPWALLLDSTRTPTVCTVNTNE